MDKFTNQKAWVLKNKINMIQLYSAYKRLIQL